MRAMFTAEDVQNLQTWQVGRMTIAEFCSIRLNGQWDFLGREQHTEAVSRFNNLSRNLTDQERADQNAYLETQGANFRLGANGLVGLDGLPFF